MEFQFVNYNSGSLNFSPIDDERETLNALSQMPQRARNQNPCQPCKSAKRRCDLATPKCERCNRQNLECRVMNTRSNNRHSNTKNLNSRPLLSAPEGWENRHDNDLVGQDFDPLPQLDPVDSPGGRTLYSLLMQDSNILAEPEGLGPSNFPQWDRGDPNDSLEGIYQSSQSGILGSMATEILAPPYRSLAPPMSPPYMGRVQSPRKQQDQPIATKGGDAARRQLWHIYTSKLVNTLAAYKSDLSNPLVDHLLPRALERPTFRSAVLYLAFVMKSRSNELRSPQNLIAGGESVTDPQLGICLEREALSDIESNLVQAKDSDLSLNTLATLLIVCNAYIASSNSRLFYIYSEQAFLLAKKLATDLSRNEEFIFVVQCLGYMHTAAMLSPGDYNIRAPDFLSIISSSQQSSKEYASQELSSTPIQTNSTSETNAEARSQHLEAVAIKRLRLEFYSSCFSDIIITTGISRSVARVLYNIGRLSQLRSSVADLGDENRWFWEAFEADLDCLELQLDQISLDRSHRLSVFEASVNRLNLIEDQRTDEELRHTIDLNRYNDALVHCARIALLERVKHANHKDESILDATEKALTLCSLISSSSHTSKLLVLPLYTAGMWASTPETQAFVRSRFRSLHDAIVTDTRALLEILEERWANPPTSPIPTRSNDIFVLY